MDEKLTTLLDADLVLARIRAHRNNIHRYRRLLRTHLSDLERQFIKRRLAEEQAAVGTLATANFPAAFLVPAAQQACAAAMTEP